MNEPLLPNAGSTGRHERRSGPSRRGVLVAGGAVVVAGAGGGVALALATARTGTTARPVARVSAELLAAEAAETALIAGLDTAPASSSGPARAMLRQVRADHVAHARALRALIAQDAYPARPPTPRKVGSVPGGTVRGREIGASGVAAARALRMSGDAAVLLASISACEATHAELLA